MQWPALFGRERNRPRHGYDDPKISTREGLNFAELLRPKKSLLT
jgi:hypothetical protein